MRDFQRNNDAGRGRSFGKKRDFGNRNAPRPTMFQTRCSKCGKECEVPFRPTGERPVFCRECFRENGNEGRPEERNFSRPAMPSAPLENGQYKEQLALLNEKVDKILSILTAAVSANDTSEMEVVETEPVVEKKKRVSKKAL